MLPPEVRSRDLVGWVGFEQKAGKFQGWCGWKFLHFVVKVLKVFLSGAELKVTNLCGEKNMLNKKKT